ncbi:RNA-binding protein [Candidatus Micrarchaeota archaeon]|nr:RNA-binding protein [Candidatus Micrarchaeota archaeon]
MSDSEKRIVLPGETVSDSPYRSEGTFVENGKTYASIVSLMYEGKVIPLKGYYIPKYSDYAIGIVVEERFNGYVVDLNSPYAGQLSSRESREQFKIGDVISAKIISVNEVKEAVLVEPRRFWGGEIIEIEYVKVPRVIGKNASMLQLLKQYTKTDIFVGKNGRIYLKGGDTALTSLVILKICREAHTSGLTDRVKEFLEKETKTGI